MMRSGAEDGKPVPSHDGWGHLYSLYMFGHLALSLDNSKKYMASRSCAKSLPFYHSTSHSIGAQFQQTMSEISYVR